MSVTVVELIKNMRKYIVMAAKQDIYIVEEGKIVARLSSPKQEGAELVESLIGILPDTITLEEAKEERLSAI